MLISEISGLKEERKDARLVYFFGTCKASDLLEREPVPAMTAKHVLLTTRVPHKTSSIVRWGPDCGLWLGGKSKHIHVTDAQGLQNHLLALVCKMVFNMTDPVPFQQGQGYRGITSTG